MASVPIFRYSSCCTTTDAQTVRPYRSRIALLETDALSLDTRHFATRLAVLQRTHRPCVPTGVVLLCWRRTPFAGHDRASLYFATRLAVLQRTHRPCVPTEVVLLCWRRAPFAGHDRASRYFATRLAVLQRTHRPSVPTGVVLLCWRRTLFRWTRS